MKIALELLDPTQGHPIQVWRFEGRPVVRIGRADGSDVHVVDPRVSRLHAELHHDGWNWRLISRGRNAVLVDGAAVDEHRLVQGSTFRLCSGGPVFRFQEEMAPEGGTTIDGSDLRLLELLTIDEGKKEEEVRQITSGPLFRRLKERADELRQRRVAAEASGDPGGAH